MDNFKISKSPAPKLEISVKMGCARFCDYCPQHLYINSYKKKLPQEKKTLDIETINEISKNIPKETIIAWTGFTEPLDCDDFPEIVKHFHSRGLKQSVSTTLCGREKAIIFFKKNLDLFTEITLHLPDAHGYMKGKFDEKYQKLLADVFEEIKNEDIQTYTIFLIGDDFHLNIKNIVEKYKKILDKEKFLKAKYINTRNSNIDTNKFNLQQTKKIDAYKSKNKYYCSYRRLNRGVLLPSGDVALCCNDYGLDYLRGSLKKNNLNDLYNSIENNEKDAKSFSDGTFSPCNKCEHYTPIVDNLVRETSNRK